MPTPGKVAARLANCRPLSGSPSMRRGSTTPPTTADVACISGLAATTFTVCFDRGYSKCKIDMHDSADIHDGRRCSTVVKPGRDAVMS